MKLHFVFSKTREKEKLLSIFDEYQWFIDNDFPIILPKFYNKVYQQNKTNKKDFIAAVTKELNAIYNQGNYQENLKKVKTNWQKIETDIFNVFKRLDLDLKDKYICSISLYGPEGQFKYPNIINLRIHNSKDVRESNETIAHELIHLLISDKVQKANLNYKQIEGVVDLFFTQTELKKIFPQYKLQSIANHDKKLFQQIIGKI